MMGLPPPPRPPDGAPPIIATRLFADEPDATLTERARIAGGRLVVDVDPTHPVSGQALLPDRFRDIVLDVVVSLDTGTDEDRCGVYLRQTADRRYVVFGITPLGRILIALVDAQESMPLADADLAPDMPFARGVGAENRITVVSIGPSLTFMLNGAAVTGITVDRRYQEGVVGAFVQRTGANLHASASVRWVQVRAVLADQPAR